MLTAAEENQNTLMVLTGMSEESSATLLALRVRVISSAEGDFPKLAADIRLLLERTLVVVPFEADCDLELAVGIQPTMKDALYLSLSDEAMRIETFSNDAVESTRKHIAGITRKGCACFAAGFALSRLIGDDLHGSPGNTFVLRFANLGFPVEEIEEPLDLNDSVLAGGGGVASGFLWGLEELKPIGKLAIVDPKKVRHGNANRCLYFWPSDSDYKAELLAARVDLPNVQITPHIGSLHDYVASRSDKRLPLLICTADSRRVRRSFQNELPRIVFDASTTDISEVVIHSHRQPNENACLSCIYNHVEIEEQRERHIAETLGLTLDEVRAGFVDYTTAGKLSEKFPQLDRDHLTGTAFDSLHKALCGQQALATPAAQQAAAPFAFVSNLAGVLLALEMYRRQTSLDGWGRTNYMALSPWLPPHNKMRRLRGRLPGCEFCSSHEALEALKSVWTNSDENPTLG